MNVLDLFSGLEGFSQAFKDRGHRVFTVDINPKFKPDSVADIMDLAPKDFPFKPQVILASPPCNCFSVASIGKHWKGGVPDEETRKAIKLVSHTISLILNLHPKYWVLENPMGMLRKVLGKPQYPITQCQYGRKEMKATDLWGVLPKRFKAKKCKPGSLCHIAAPRGSRFGIQNSKLSPESKAKIPYGLSKAICLICEKELVG